MNEILMGMYEDNNKLDFMYEDKHENTPENIG